MNNYYDTNKKKENVQLLKTYPHFSFFEKDISDIGIILKDLKRKNRLPHIVIHLAGSAGVRHSLENPELYISNNISKYVRLIEECYQFRIHSVFYASSSSVYGLNEDYPFSEDDVLNRLNSPYAITKKCMEDFSSMYSRLYKMQIIGMRFFTVYGPRGRPDMSPYKFLKFIRDNNTILLYGDPSNIIRDFTYIDDVIDGILKLIERRNRLLECDIFNFGSGNPIKLIDFLKLCEEIVGKPAKTKLIENQSGDVPVTYANIEKAKVLLDFYPKMTHLKGLELMYKSLGKKPIRLVPLPKNSNTKQNEEQNDTFIKKSKSNNCRKIVFLSQFPQLGSNYLRGNQVCDELNKRGINAEIFEIQKDKGKMIDENDPDLLQISNSIVVIISRYRHTIVSVLKKQNNIIVYDIVDKFCEIHNQVGHCQLIANNVDAIIFPNKKTQEDFTNIVKKENFISVVIHHHWDPRLENMIFSPAEKLTFGFMGSVASSHKNCMYLRELINKYDLEVLDTELCKYMTNDVRKGKMSNIWKWMDRLVENNIIFNCHLSIRKKDSEEWKYKTNTKISTAAFFESPILTTREDTLSEIMSSDYPYFIENTDIKSVFDGIEYVIATYKTDIWYKAVEIMSRLKPLLSIKNLCSHYIDLFCSFEKYETSTSTNVINDSKLNNVNNEIEIYDKEKGKQNIVCVSSISEIKAEIDKIQRKNNRKFVLYSVNINNYDNMIDLDILKMSPFIDYVYLTDSINNIDKNKLIEANWNIIVFKNDENYDFFILSRVLKICNQRFFNSYQSSIYIDSNIQVNNDVYPLFENVLNIDCDMALFKHPQRNTLYEEFERVIVKNVNVPEIKKNKLKEQYLFYKSQNYDNNNVKYTLTWNNILIRKHNDIVEKLMETWFHEVFKFGQRDQLSFLYSWWLNDSCRVKILPLNNEEYPDFIKEYKDKDYRYFSYLNYYFSRPNGGNHNIS